MALLLPQTAPAYTIETIATRGCHEEITIDAWRVVASALPEVTTPLPSRGDDEALIDDVAFGIPSDLDDIGVTTLLLGVRDNDVKTLGVTELKDLAGVTADPQGQKEHCLRAPDHDEPNGSQEAVDDCRAFIRETLLSALDGLDEQGQPDGTKREPLRVWLAIRGEVTVGVPIFYLRAGRGLHAIQDSFTHTFRSPSGKVTVVVNWVEFAENELNEDVDGPAHMVDLDQCDNADDLLTERHNLAIEASIAALNALLDPTLNRDAKVAAVDAVIDEYVSFDTESECTAANDWCNAPENQYQPSCGCRAAGAAAPLRTIDWVLPLLALGVLFVRRRGLVILALAILSPRMAHAEPLGVVKALEGNSKAATPGNEDPAGAFFGRVAAGASYDQPAFNAGAGARYQLSRPLMLGFDVEHNPWIAISPGKVRPGSLNAYFSLIRRFQLKNDSVNVRTTASLGMSVLLFDLVGAPTGSVGPFLGLSFLGVEWKASPGFYLTIDPTYIAIPMPNLTGIPFAYPQYRFQVGVEFGG